MKITFTNEKKEVIGNRGLIDNEGLCQMIVDLNGYFLPRNKTIIADITINGKPKERWILNNQSNVYDLFSMIFKEWRFIDEGWQIKYGRSNT